MYKNKENYNDPTAGAAIGNIVGKERTERRVSENRRKRKIKRRPKIYIASPYAGDVNANVKKAIAYCCYAIKQGKMPIASHLMYPAILSDKAKEEREMGMLFGLSLLALCQEIWICGDKLTRGMKDEIDEARRLGKTVRYISDAEVEYALKDGGGDSV